MGEYERRIADTAVYGTTRGGLKQITKDENGRIDALAKNHAKVSRENPKLTAEQRYQKMVTKRIVKNGDKAMHRNTDVDIAKHMIGHKNHDRHKVAAAIAKHSPMAAKVPPRHRQTYANSVVADAEKGVAKVQNEREARTKSPTHTASKTANLQAMQQFRDKGLER